MRHIFNTVPSLDETFDTIDTLIRPMATVAGVFCARLWEVVRALCPFSKY